MSTLWPKISEKWLKESYERATGERPKRVAIAPLMLGHAARLFNIPLDNLYKDTKLCAYLQHAAHEIYDFDMPVLFWNMAYFTREYGGTIKYPGKYGETLMVDKRPFKTVDDVEKMEVLSKEELVKGRYASEILDHQDKTKEITGKYFIPSMHVCDILSVAASLLEMDQLLIWMIKQPDVVHTLLRKCGENLANTAGIVADRYGSCGMTVCSVLGNNDVLAPKQYVEFYIQHVKPMVEECLRKGAGPGIWYDQCGNHELIWREMVKLPFTDATIIHPGYSNDRKKTLDPKIFIPVYGKIAKIAGNIPTQMMHLGNPVEIYEESCRQIRECRESPKDYCLATACETPPDTPPVNCMALTKAARDCML